MKKILASSEIVLIIGGVLMLASAYAVYATGYFGLFWVAKVLYLIGVLWLLLKR